MYLEFLLLIFDYFKTLKFKSLVFEIILPAGFSLFLYCTTRDCQIVEFAKGTSSNAISLLGILLGFSITVIATLASSGSPNIEAMKVKMTDYKVGGQTVSLFKLLLINLSYAVVLEALSLVANLCLPAVWTDYGIYTIKFLYCADMFFLLHILLLNIRNITDFYFTLFKKEASPPTS